MIRSLVAQVSAVTGVGESVRVTRCRPSLVAVTIREPPLPSSKAHAWYLPLGENATALGEDGSICVGVPKPGNSTRPPGTSGACGMTPSGVDVGLADDVAGAALTEGDGDPVEDCGRRPTVLSTEPSGA